MQKIFNDIKNTSEMTKKLFFRWELEFVTQFCCEWCHEHRKLENEFSSEVANEFEQFF